SNSTNGITRSSSAGGKPYVFLHALVCSFEPIEAVWSTSEFIDLVNSLSRREQGQRRRSCSRRMLRPDATTRTDVAARYAPSTSRVAAASGRSPALSTRYCLWCSRGADVGRLRYAAVQRNSRTSTS